LHAYERMCSRHIADYRATIIYPLFLSFSPRSLFLSTLTRFAGERTVLQSRRAARTRPHRARRSFPIRNTRRNVRQCGAIFFSSFFLFSFSLARFGNAISCAMRTRAGLYRAARGHGIAACKLTGYPRRALNHFVENNACSSSSCSLTVTFRLIPSNLCCQRTLRISWTTNFLSSARKVERSRDMSKSRLYDPFYREPRDKIRSNEKRARD